MAEPKSRWQNQNSEDVTATDSVGPMLQKPPTTQLVGTRLAYASSHLQGPAHVDFLFLFPGVEAVQTLLLLKLVNPNQRTSHLHMVSFKLVVCKQMGMWEVPPTQIVMILGKGVGAATRVSEPWFATELLFRVKVFVEIETRGLGHPVHFNHCHSTRFLQPAWRMQGTSAQWMKC